MFDASNNQWILSVDVLTTSAGPDPAAVAQSPAASKAHCPELSSDQGKPNPSWCAHVSI